MPDMEPQDVGPQEEVIAEDMAVDMPFAVVDTVGVPVMAVDMPVTAVVAVTAADNTDNRLQYERAILLGWPFCLRKLQMLFLYQASRRKSRRQSKLIIEKI
jgi:hypothetical protein